MTRLMVCCMMCIYLFVYSMFMNMNLIIKPTENGKGYPKTSPLFLLPSSFPFSLINIYTFGVCMWCTLCSIFMLYPSSFMFRVTLWFFFVKNSKIKNLCAIFFWAKRVSHKKKCLKDEWRMLSYVRFIYMFHFFTIFYPSNHQPHKQSNENIFTIRYPCSVVYVFLYFIFDSYSNSFDSKKENEEMKSSLNRWIVYTLVCLIEWVNVINLNINFHPEFHPKTVKA